MKITVSDLQKQAKQASTLKKKKKSEDSTKHYRQNRSGEDFIYQLHIPFRIHMAEVTAEEFYIATKIEDSQGRHNR